MRRVGNLYDMIADYDNLLLAYLKAIRGKRQKRDVVRFNHDFSENIDRLLCDIKEEIVEVGDYHYFYISDPKRRKICAAPLRERILHHAIMNVCHPIFDRNLIATTYATRKGKGQYQALNELKSKLGYYKVAVKLDYRKYFDSIDHETLKLILRRSSQYIDSLQYTVYQYVSIAKRARETNWAQIEDLLLLSIIGQKTLQKIQ